MLQSPLCSSFCISFSSLLISKHFIMKFYLLPIFIFLTLALVATYAASPPELYWKSMLPATPMPKAITDLLLPDITEGKSSLAGEVNIDTEPEDTSVIVGAGGVNVDVGGGGTQVSVSPFIYSYAAPSTQLHSDPNVALFFLENDLQNRTKFTLHFTKTSNTKPKFLSRQAASSIPFSLNKIDDILKKFSVKAESEEGETMKNTIKECEERGIKGEEKYCATSLESMVDFSIAKLGLNIEAVSTEAEEEIQMQNYEIAPGAKKLGNEKKGNVVCHREKYPYAVFYCHYTESIRVYSVRLEGEDGGRVKALAICHEDTSEWNPKHLAFQVLKVKAGTTPVCHFLPDDHVVWVSK